MPDTDEYFRANRDLWNKWTELHVKSKFYDVEGFKRGRNTLHSIELNALGDVKDKNLLHLQCHFGMDTLSWARLGARVTGVDFSPRAIQTARDLSAEIRVPATFIEANIYDLPSMLHSEFDIVFTSYGTIYWLPDLQRWAAVIARFLKPGGVFFIADAHPFTGVFENEGPVTECLVRYPYFHEENPMRWETNGSYADSSANVHGVEFGWQHSMGDIVNSLIGAGLIIEDLSEYPFCVWRAFPFLEQDTSGMWRPAKDRVQVPLTFSIEARKP